MGFFSRREAPTTSRLVARVDTNAAPGADHLTMTYTLDRPEDGGRLWIHRFLDGLLSGGPTNGDDLIYAIMRRCCEVIEAQIPSITFDKLTAQADGTDLVITGDAHYLASELDRLRAEASKGQIYSPRQ